MHQMTETRYEVARMERERELEIARRLENEPWIEPTGLRRYMRNVAIRLRGYEQQVQLERMWHREEIRRKLRPSKGW